MSAGLLRAAVDLARVWTRIYTLGMPPWERDARRVEIESDLWEFEQDHRTRGIGLVRTAGHALARLVLGMPDDLRWRIERTPRRQAWRTVFAASTAAAAIYSVLWLTSVMKADLLPTPHPLPAGRAFDHPPPPPPPPPLPPPRPRAR